VENTEASIENWALLMKKLVPSSFSLRVTERRWAMGGGGKVGRYGGGGNGVGVGVAVGGRSLGDDGLVW
jgi:hypothetical protein